MLVLRGHNLKRNWMNYWNLLNTLKRSQSSNMKINTRNSKRMRFVAFSSWPNMKNHVKCVHEKEKHLKKCSDSEKFWLEKTFEMGPWITRKSRKHILKRSMKNRKQVHHIWWDKGPYFNYVSTFLSMFDQLSTLVSIFTTVTDKSYSTVVSILQTK